MINYIVSVLTEGAIFAIMALGLNIVWGWSGDFDLAFYGYVALGAYMTLVLTVGPATEPSTYILGLSLPFPIAVILAALSAMVLALIVGAIALRHLRGIYFSIVTLGAVYVLYIFAGQFVPLFNGFNGLSGLFDPMGDFFGLDFGAYPFFYLGLCVAVLVVVYLLVARLSTSRFGLALRSLREDERAAAAFGRDIYTTKLKAYVLGAGLGGLGGGLFAGYLERVQHLGVVACGDDHPVRGDPRRRARQHAWRALGRAGHVHGVAGDDPVPARDRRQPQRRTRASRDHHRRRPGPVHPLPPPGHPPGAAHA